MDALDHTPAPWERQPGESNKAFQAARLYFQAGAHRSIVDLAKANKGRINSWKLWSKSFDWVERATAYDDHMEGIAQEAAEAAARDEAAKRAAVWAERRDRLQEREFAIAEKLMDQAETMLRMPIAETEVKKGEDGNITIIKPVGWRKADAAKFMETASKLGRLSSGLSTERSEVNLTKTHEEALTELE